MTARIRFVQAVIAPTGHYNVHDTVNVGRNYWAFDSSVSATWLSQKTGTEISLLPGFMVNTKNGATHYRSGNEFHLDFILNQFLAKTFAVGFQGSFYHQVTGDGGSGALLGAFKSESVGVGPAVLWLPAFGGGKLSVVAKWLHDVEATHRLSADYGQLTIGYQF